MNVRHSASIAIGRRQATNCCGEKMLVAESSPPGLLQKSIIRYGSPFGDRGEVCFRSQLSVTASGGRRSSGAAGPRGEVIERVDAVITDLGKGRIRGQKLGELGKAVTSAEADAKVGRAIGAGRRPGQSLAVQLDHYEGPVELAPERLDRSLSGRLRR